MVDKMMISWNRTSRCLAALCRSTRILAGASVATIVVMFCPTTAMAQLDRLYPVTGSPITGTVVDVRPDGVVMKVGSANRPFRVDEITKVTFEGDPPQLTRGRDFAINGEFQSALDQLKQVDIAAIKREFIAADAAFYLVASQARLALSGQGDKESAVNGLKQFAGKFSNSWHFFEAAELLGDLATASGDFANATRYYSALGRSSSPIIKSRANYLSAVSSQRQGNPQEAIAGYDKVIAEELDSTAGARLKILARAGRAVATAETGGGAEALAEVNQLVKDLNPDDAELAAKIYNARGAANQATDNTEAALLDYLHTHLLFSSVADAHAEALSQMVKLWPKVNKPERAAEARQELQTKYPGWGG
jgi:tetratricopeptide (TPR) repeat protein